MTIEEKAKAYDEALEQAKKELNTCGSLDCDAARQIFRLFPELREKPLTPFQQCLSHILYKVYYASAPGKVDKFILDIIKNHTDELVELAKRQEKTDCQLSESEDEKARKCLIAMVNASIWDGSNLASKKACLDWLKKQKDAFENGRQLGIMQEQARQELEWPDEKQKEQKPVEPAGKLSREEYLYQLLIDQLITYSDYEYLTGKNPVWSEEDEKLLDFWLDVIDRNDWRMDENFCKASREFINRLKSLHLQPKQEWSEKDKKILQSLHHVMNCADAQNAVKRDDLSIEDVCTFLFSVQPSWKPSEQEKGALRTAIHVLTEERNFPKAASHLQAILDVFDGKESRKDWKPTEEQMEALKWLVEYISPSEKHIVIVKNLYEQLKKLM